MNEEQDTYMVVENVSTTDRPHYKIIESGFLNLVYACEFLKSYHNTLHDSCAEDVDSFTGKYTIVKSVAGDFQFTGRIR
jgi:hypothetical protein